MTEVYIYIYFWVSWHQSKVFTKPDFPIGKRSGKRLCQEKGDVELWIQIWSNLQNMTIISIYYKKLQYTFNYFQFINFLVGQCECLCAISLRVIHKFTSSFIAAFGWYYGNPLPPSTLQPHQSYMTYLLEVFSLPTIFCSTKKASILSRVLLHQYFICKHESLFQNCSHIKVKHFNQYQTWITNLKNQITDDGHSLWFAFFWLVWISIRTISIKFLIICPNHNHYTNKSESRLSYNFAQTIKFAWLSMLIAKYWVWFKIWESPHKRYPLNFVCVSKNVWNVM